MAGSPGMLRWRERAPLRARGWLRVYCRQSAPADNRSRRDGDDAQGTSAGRGAVAPRHGDRLRARGRAAGLARAAGARSVPAGHHGAVDVPVAGLFAARERVPIPWAGILVPLLRALRLLYLLSGIQTRDRDGALVPPRCTR